MTAFTITPLAEKPELVDCCAAWSYGEWGTQIETRNLMTVYEDYRSSIDGDNLPLTWIALAGTKPAGMIRFKANDPAANREDLTPWLSSLYVHPRYRQQGLAALLCEHVEVVAKKRGFDKIHLFTGSAEKMYEKMGYKTIDNVPDPSGYDKNGKAVMMKAL